MAGGDESTRGGLGRLFAALVGNGSDKDSPKASASRRAADNTSVLDLDGLSRSLVKAGSPMRKLAELVRDVKGRAERCAAGDASALAPSALELHLAQRLEEAGVLDEKLELPRVRAVRTVTSDLFYLRVDDGQLSYAAEQRIFGAEAALNGALLASACLEDADSASEEELVQVEQRVARSIVAQAGEVAAELDEPARGEWGVRHAISRGIECLRLPHRLTARFRTNVAAGLLAIEVDLTSPDVFPATAYVDGLGVVPATGDMRRRAATDYNLRLGVLLASYAFAAAEELREVWIAGVMDTATSHHCYYSVRVGREELEALDPAAPFDPCALMYALGATMDEDRGQLRPVRQGFSLEGERFCPVRRYDPVELSFRGLDAQDAHDLGCKYVFELGIDETRRRRDVAAKIMRGMGDSTEKNVRLILDLSQADGTEEVRQAALRCVGGLIEGTLAEDPCAVADEFVDGDPLTRRTLEARGLLMEQDLKGAERRALEALAEPEAAGTYADTATLSWRAFGSHVDRVLYNRLLARRGTHTVLVPAGYYEANLIASTAELAQGNADDATRHARRAARIAPLSVQASLALVRALTADGKTEDARQELCRLLSLAHEPEGLGMGYLYMAALTWQEGDVLAAQACFQRSRRYVSSPALSAGVQVVAILSQANQTMLTELTDEQVQGALRDAGIPIAPTEEVAGVIFEGARAATDAEVFPVAREFMETIGVMTRDDVYFGMLRSLEGEPDR